MRSPMTLDPLSGRSVTVEFGPDAKGLACGAEFTLYPKADRPSKARVYGPVTAIPYLISGKVSTDLTVATPTSVREIGQGRDTYILDTPLVLVPGRQYSIFFDPASRPALICTDDKGNQYSSNVRGKVSTRGPQYDDIARFISDQMAKQSQDHAKILSDLFKKQAAAYTKAMRDLAKGSSWAAPIEPHTKTLSEEALTKAVEALRRKR